MLHSEQSIADLLTLNKGTQAHERINREFRAYVDKLAAGTAQTGH